MFWMNKILGILSWYNIVKDRYIHTLYFLNVSQNNIIARYKIKNQTEISRQWAVEAQKYTEKNWHYMFESASRKIQ